MKNKVQLIGHLGAAPEVKTTANGSKYARMSIATDEVYTNKKGEKVTDTTWHQVVGWDKTAEIIEQRLVKGTYVLIEGKLTNRQWEDKNGEKRFITEVLCTNLLVLEKKAAMA